VNGRSIIKRVALLPYDFVERTLIGENDESEAARPIAFYRGERYRHGIIDNFYPAYRFASRWSVGRGINNMNPIGVSVIDDFHGLNLSKILEVGFEGVFVRISRASDEQLPILLSPIAFFFQTGMFF